jgi:amphi-Trp domain-containing protein
MADKRTLEYTATVKAEAAAAYLEAIAQGLRAGHIVIDTGQEALGVHVTGEVSIELEARSNEKGKSSIEVSLGWRATPKTAAPAPPLVISSTPPTSAYPSPHSGADDAPFS